MVNPWSRFTTRYHKDVLLYQLSKQLFDTSAFLSKFGRQYRTSVLAEPEFRAALLAKLVEEDQEVQAAPAAELLSELADVMEVFDTILTTCQLTMPQVREVQEQRRQTHGGFNNRLPLGWVGE